MTGVVVMFTNNKDGKHWPHNLTSPVTIAELLDREGVN